MQSSYITINTINQPIEATSSLFINNQGIIGSSQNSSSDSHPKNTKNSKITENKSNSKSNEKNFSLTKNHN